MTKTRCEVYSRVCGYLRPITQWNEGKQAEFKDRKMFNSQKENKKEDKNMVEEYGQKDGSQKGKLSGGKGKNQTDKCRNPEVKKEREQ